jgi:hypothetical protein
MKRATHGRIRRISDALMSNSLRHLPVVLGLALVAGGLSGCGTINGYLASGISDYFPHWAGGIPPDAPPRPGSAKYDEFMKERERKRLEPASPPEETGKTSSPSLDAIH